MLVKEKQNTVITNNNSQEHSFGMKTSAKSFKILSSSIYEHKIRAIIRELCCNASDSHIVAGKRETPIRVFLPTLFEQVFVVEDYGIGLSHEDVIHVYTTYFESTKTESADETGALGLGSKSPFCYQNQMSVISRKDGVERSYSCYIGEDGEPKTRLRSENNTNESNGVKVTVPVNQNDINDFEMEAKRIFSFFEVKPDCNKEIQSYLSQEDFETILNEGYLELEQNNSLTYSSKIYAVMGNVAYPVNPNFSFCKSPILLNSEEVAMYGDEEQYYEFNQDDVEYTEFIVQSTNKCIFVNFELGELDFAASRETLSFDNETKIAFYKKLVEKCSENRKVFQDELDQSENEIDALFKFIKKYGNSKDKISKIFYYDGVQIFNLHGKYAFDFTKKEIIQNGDYNFEANVRTKDVRRFDLVRNQTNIRMNVKQDEVSRITFNHLINMKNVDIVNEKITCIYIDDPKLKSGAIKLIRHYIKERLGNEKTVFFVNEKDGQKIDDKFGLFEFYPISKIRDYVKKADPDFFSSNRGGSRGSLGLDERSFQGRVYSKLSVSRSKKIDPDDYPKEDCAYLMWNGDDTIKIQNQDDGKTCILLRNNIEFLMDCIGIKYIFLMNQRNQKKILKAGYRNFIDVIREDYYEMKDRIQYFHNMNMDINSSTKNIFSHLNGETFRTKRFNDTVAERIVHHDRKISKQIREFEKIVDNYDIEGDSVSYHPNITGQLKTIKRVIGCKKWKEVKPKNELVGIYSKIVLRFQNLVKENYPLINMIETGYGSRLTEVVSDHIILYIDSVNANKAQ